MAIPARMRPRRVPGGRDCPPADPATGPTPASGPGHRADAYQRADAHQRAATGPTPTGRCPIGAGQSRTARLNQMLLNSAENAARSGGRRAR